MTNPAPKPEKDETENLPKARKAAARHKRAAAPRRPATARRTAEPLPPLDAYAPHDPEAAGPIDGAASAPLDPHAAAPLQPAAHPKQSDLAEEVGAKLAIFEDMVFPTPAQIATMRKMDTLRHMGLHQASSVQRRAYRFLQPSGAGKSTCAKLLKKSVENQPGRDRSKKPVLHVTLSTTGTPKSLATSILSAFGDGYAGRGEADILLERVKLCMQEFGVELLIIDELNHFRQKHLAADAANTIKNILTLGWAPIVLMGTDEAQSLFANNRELKNRCAPQDILRPYDFNDEDNDLPVWIEFMKRIDAGMVSRGVLEEKSGLNDPTLAKDLCEASNGLIGEFHNIVLSALEPALLAGESHLSYDRLVEAIDAWCLADGTIDHNPLRLRRTGEAK